MNLGKLPEARALALESLVIKRTLGDQQLVSQALTQPGIIDMYLADYISAKVWYEQAIAISEAVADQASLANATLSLASASK